MRRADRLFQIVQLIRGRRLTTAAFLAQRLEVSERTVYRDVADLQRQGVPIEGEAGVGYRLGAGFDLPPLMFTQDEATALVASARLAQSWVDPAHGARHPDRARQDPLGAAAGSARLGRKPGALRAALALDDGTRARLQTLREAVQSRNKLRMDYRDVSGAPSQRIVRPLGCFYWGKVWTFSAWCELRTGLSRLPDRPHRPVDVLPDRFRDEPGKTLAEMLRRLQEDPADPSPPIAVASVQPAPARIRSRRRR